jgi:hypothetical protein
VTARRTDGALLDLQEGGAQRARGAAPGGATVEVALRFEATPLLSTELLPGAVGLLRIGGFEAGAAAAASLRAALTSFEDAGARGWLIHLRWRGRGVSIPLSRLLRPPPAPGASA